MMPPIVRRCPECGVVRLNRRFTVVADDTDRRLVECPSCDQRFKPLDGPWLN